MKRREDYKRLARVHKALSNEARIMIVDELKRGERTVGWLTKRVALDQSTVSKHLSALLASGIVESRKEGKNIYYRLLCPCVLDMLACTFQVLKESKGKR
ncbi:MAG: hypothetical protein Kow0090_05110 [Myxococcota bacterium]